MTLCKGICEHPASYDAPIKRYYAAKKCLICKWWQDKDRNKCECCNFLLRTYYRRGNTDKRYNAELVVQS